MDSIWPKDGGYLSKGAASSMNSIMTNRRVRLWTIVTDLVFINLGFWLAYQLRYERQLIRAVDESNFVPFREYIPQLLLFNLFLIVAFSQTAVWRRRRGESFFDEVYRIGYAMTASFMVLIAYQYLFQATANSRLMIFWLALITGGFLAVARLTRRWTMRGMYARGIGTDKVIVVGSGEAGRGMIRTLLARPDLGFKALGYLDLDDSLGSRRIPRLGRWEDLEEIIEKNPELHSVFIALPASHSSEILQMTRICQIHRVRAQIVPDLLQLSLGKVEITSMGGIPVLGVKEQQISRIGRFLKRLMDLAIVGIFALPGIPVGLLIALAIKLEDGGPIFYEAKRMGQNGEMFGMYKFRSMVTDADKLRAKLWEQNEAEGAIFKIKDDPRVTKVGKFIRKMSLDELPQFINIFLGQMSFVGPRPPIQDEVEQYDKWHYRRFGIKGGLTGLWQVSGRADLTFDEAVLLDIYYIENWSLALDIRIILQTIPYILLRRGAY